MSRRWWYLPYDLPPHTAVYHYYFPTWRDDGTDRSIHDLLRDHAREPQQEGIPPRLRQRGLATTRRSHCAPNSDAWSDETSSPNAKPAPGLFAANRRSIIPSLSIMLLRNSCFKSIKGHISINDREYFYSGWSTSGLIVDCDGKSGREE